MTTRRSLSRLLVSLALFAGCDAGPPGDGLTEGEDPGVRGEESLKCAGPTVEGVDVSDGQGTINWAAARGAGIEVMFAKATQGTYNTQSTFAHNWSASRQAGVLRGAYHFFDPREDGVAQAHHFLAVMGPLSDGDLPPMLDLECPDGDPRCLGFSGGDGKAPGGAIRQRVMDFLNTVQSATGRRPLIYTFSSYFSGAGVSTAGLSGYPLFIAYPTANNCFNVPSPWGAATVWQYSWHGHVPGIPGEVDRDRFLGTRTDLLAFAKSGGGGGGNGNPPPQAACYSSTLQRNVAAGTCVQSMHDAQWYHCDNGNWASGETGCVATYGYCHSGTLNRDLAPRSCVQSKFDRVWYQCDDGWKAPVASGAGPLGPCSVEYGL